MNQVLDSGSIDPLEGIITTKVASTSQRVGDKNKMGRGKGNNKKQNSYQVL